MCVLRAWALNHPDSGQGDTVPHISEMNIRILADGFEQTAARMTPYWYRGVRLDIKLDGQSFRLGRASGDGCNCLIDTLRQQIPGVICSVPLVRSELERRHRGRPTEILPGAYLPLELWDDIVDLLGFHNAEKRVHTSWAHRFKVACIDLTWIGSGEVLPLGATSDTHITTLAIARVNQNHFVPLFPLREHDARWQRPES